MTLGDRVKDWRRMWKLASARRRLKGLRQEARAVDDEMSRVAIIEQANALLTQLEADGHLSRTARLELAREWVKSHVCDRLPALYRAKNAKEIALLGWFLKAN